MKIAIINFRKHDNIGGMETYNYFLINFLLKSNHQVTEFPTQPETKKTRKMIFNKNFKVNNQLVVNSIWKKIKFYYQEKHLYQKMCKEYDIVILSGGPLHQTIKYKNLIYIYHFDKRWYEKREEISFFEKIFLFCISPKKYKFNPIKECKNVVFPSVEKCSYNIPGQNKYECMVAFNDHHSYVINNNKKNILYIGRLENQKNIVNLSKKLKQYKNFYVVGSGSKMNKISSILGTKNILGPKFKKDINSELDKTKLLVLASKNEGSCIVLAEAAARGVPSITFDTFAMAKYWKDSKCTITIKKNDWKEYIKQINYVFNLDNNQYNKWSSEINDFSNKHLTVKSFERSWELIINKFKG